uniref:Uncharacterized protein n=1 Tax=Schistosoma japonicum TaxID=6182 RepID=Q5BYF0_SCHJA|nr:unknown [Schistosoma japonicum]
MDYINRRHCYVIELIIQSSWSRKNQLAYQKIPFLLLIVFQSVLKMIRRSK